MVELSPGVFLSYGGPKRSIPRSRSLLLHSAAAFVLVALLSWWRLPGTDSHMLDIEPHILLLQVAREALAVALVTGPVLIGLLCLTRSRRPGP